MTGPMTEREKTLATLCLALLTCTAILLAGLIAEAGAVEWHTANQSTVEWDAVADYALDPGERMAYRVMAANQITDPEKTAPEVVATTTQTSHTLTLGVKGSYTIGVESVVQVQNAAGEWEEVAVSETASWSDVAEHTATGTPFGVRYYPAPSAPSGLRMVQGGE